MSRSRRRRQGVPTRRAGRRDRRCRDSILTALHDGKRRDAPYAQAALEGTSLLTQTGVIQGLGPADPNALFFVWGGANDIGINPSAPTVGDAVNNLATIISTLYGIGARQFLVPNLPDLSLTPYGLSLSPFERAGLQALINRL